MNKDTDLKLVPPKKVEELPDVKSDDTPQWNPNEDIEPQLNRIEQDLIAKLKSAQAIDVSNRAVKNDVFNQLIEQAIDKCLAIAKEMELAGYRDANTDNILQSRIQAFREMRANQSLSLDIQPEHYHEQDVVEKQENPANQPGGIAGIFKRGRALIARKISRDKIPTVSEENVR